MSARGNAVRVGETAVGVELEDAEVVAWISCWIGSERGAADKDSAVIGTGWVAIDCDALTVPDIVAGVGVIGQLRPVGIAVGAGSDAEGVGDERDADAVIVRAVPDDGIGAAHCSR